MRQRQVQRGKRPAKPPRSARQGAAEPISSGSNRLRIIGGQWRGRKLTFPSLPGLRPTPDRVRETLFNWLAARVPGSRCLDLFAGSGALGLEALSRGAEQVTLLDLSPLVVAQLKANLQTLECRRGEVIQTSAPTWLESPPPATGFDLVFLDPPFRQGLLAPCCELLESRHWLADEAYIYLELEAECPPETLALPHHWELLKEKSAGQVRSCLYRRQAPAQSP